MGIVKGKHIDYCTSDECEGCYYEPPAASAGYVSSVDDPSSREWQLGVLRNIEALMPKSRRKYTPNWKMVQTFLLSHTCKGGSTSSYRHCHFLGIDPDAYKFY
jgi:hypothetical protein